MKVVFAALAVMAFGPQAVLSIFNLSFSNVRQCGAVTVSFLGDTVAPDTIPAALTILPFNSKPISIPIPNSSTNMTGVDVTFLPFNNGTAFVASIQNAQGDHLGLVSDIVRVSPSPTGNSSCLPALSDASRRFEVISTPSQCNVFTVSYDVNSKAPAVRLFTPKGNSLSLNMTSNDPTQRTATYLMSAERGNQVVLLFDDGTHHPETSRLLTITGDSSSPTFCLSEPLIGSPSPVPVAASSGALSKELVIAISTGAGGAVLLVIVALLVAFFVRQRRRRRAWVGRSFAIQRPPPRYWQGVRLPPTPPTAASFTDTMVRNPPYVSERYTSSMFNSPKRRSTLSSWIQVVPADQVSPKARDVNPSERPITQTSLSSLDIEQILDLAVMKDMARDSTPGSSSEMRPSSRASAISLGPGQPLVNLPSPAWTSTERSLSPRGHLRQPSDVPSDPSFSMTLSAMFPIPPGSPEADFVQASMMQTANFENAETISHHPPPVSSPRTATRAPGLRHPRNPRSFAGAPLPLLPDSAAAKGSPGMQTGTPSRDTMSSWDESYGIAR